jgi:putative molybdopterin biosynthesis protein
MSTTSNRRLRLLREGRGWTQAELASRAGISRTAVGAIEQGRLTPSVDAALRLGRALDRRVEEIFCLGEGSPSEEVVWSGTPPGGRARYWQARVGGHLVNVPVETTVQGLLVHDGETRDGVVTGHLAQDAERTLLLSSCDPAAALLLSILERRWDLRPIGLQRSSVAALDLLQRGLIHVAGIHLARSDAPGGNAEVVRRTLGPGYSILHVAEWESGVALARPHASTLGALRKARLRWIGREAGSGARACQDEVLRDTVRPRRIAASHRAVGDALRAGWSDAGVCLRLVSEELGLAFVPVRHESYDLCFRSAEASDPRLRALVDAVRSKAYRDAIEALPGYRPSSDAGELETTG